MRRAAGERLRRGHDGFAFGRRGGAVMVVEQDGRQAAAHVEFDVVGEHAEEDVGAHAGRGPMEHRADFEIDGLYRAEGALDLGQGFVGADRLLGRERLLRHVGADDIDAVEPGLGGDRVVGAAVGEARVGDDDLEVLAHLVLVEHGSHRKADLGPAAERRALAQDRLADAAQVPLGRGHEFVALALALGRQERIAAHDQPLARIVGRGDLGQVAIVEQRELQRAGLDQLLDLRGAQGGDPVEPGRLQVLADARAGDRGRGLRPQRCGASRSAP